MSTIPAHSATRIGPAEVAYSANGKSLLLDLTGIDLSRRIVDRQGLERINPHRHEMALLDAIVWHSQDFKQGVGVWNVGEDEFWVRGHFPGKPMLPGVLQIESGAQLGVFTYNSRFPEPRICAFTHITDVSYRNPVAPGDTFFLLSQELKCSGRRFTSHIQGAIITGNDPATARVSFDAIISGMTLSA